MSYGGGRKLRVWRRRIEWKNGNGTETEKSFVNKKYPSLKKRRNFLSTKNFRIFSPKKYAPHSTPHQKISPHSHKIVERKFSSRKYHGFRVLARIEPSKNCKTEILFLLDRNPVCVRSGLRWIYEFMPEQFHVILYAFTDEQKNNRKNPSCRQFNPTRNTFNREW